MQKFCQQSENSTLGRDEFDEINTSHKRQSTPLPDTSQQKSNTVKCRVNAHGPLHDFDPKTGLGVCMVQATSGA